MTGIPDPAWKRLGATSNTDIYEVEPDVLAVVPHTDCTDNEATARESLAFQDRYWRSVGRRGGARAVYANETAQTLTTCFALVGETFFGHAVAAVFTGLAKPSVPTQVLRSLAEAMPWIAELNRERGGVL